MDNLGRVASAPFVDSWEARHGVALALEKIAMYAPAEQLDTIFHFFVPTALGDRDDQVRKQMLEAALQYVNHFGQVLKLNFFLLLIFFFLVKVSLYKFPGRLFFYHHNLARTQR